MPAEPPPPPPGSAEPTGAAGDDDDGGAAGPDVDLLGQVWIMTRVILATLLILLAFAFVVGLVVRLT